MGAFPGTQWHRTQLGVVARNPNRPISQSAQFPAKINCDYGMCRLTFFANELAINGTGPQSTTTSSRYSAKKTGQRNFEGAGLTTPERKNSI
uniref:Uncharacterized protein n=1 Tax=mine drainage metagenome TaxID=410659 RepID=E6QW08_9ZZZZ